MSNTNTFTIRPRLAAQYFVHGLVLGMLIQLITVVPNASEPARIVGNDLRIQLQNALSYETVALVIRKDVLLESARRRAAEFVAENDPVLHAAANESSSLAPPTPLPSSTSSAASSPGEQSSVSSVSSSDIPPFIGAVWPVNKVPNWGAMRTPAEWNRTYKEMRNSDFVNIPSYDLSVLTIPMKDLSSNVTAENIAKITAKLFYSTRYFAAYDVDANEFTGMHSGVDLKLALGTPIGAIGGGIVRFAANDGALGLHVMIEHQLANGEKYESIYGHLGSVAVKVGDSVTPGQTIGYIGMTGETTGPHLHLQVDRDDGTSPHIPYQPMHVPTSAEVARWSVNPITFIKEQ